ncbi:aspartyl/glutamyl-tRNA(Asn/Gln) amidotransferase subunit C [Amylolactobacillus amylophilus]|nr:aspartyl/glutamyl-tRNA(Asn/Gln) amidotransferase subunit C [Amylolactobacillus amylophilus]
MISKEDIKHVASLAKLEFTEEELAKFTTQMDEIIEMANQLGEVDVAEVAPTTQVVAEHNVFREDVIVQGESRAVLLQNVPESQDGFIKVPTIIDKDEDED